MREGTLPANTAPYDAIVIGAGISGIIFLKYAREQGLRCLALEKEDAVGGLWNWLPAWQDIQNRKQDFAINDVPLEGVKQPEVLHLSASSRGRAAFPVRSLQVMGAGRAPGLLALQR